MSANPILGLAGSLATTFLNNRMAQENASVSYNRQKDLMDIQNSMNMANASNMPGIQAFGLRKAGFNPAMVSGVGTQAPPTVSQGNADMPQTIPFNSQDALMFAQMRNLNVQADKTEEETRGVKQANDITDAANSAVAATYVQGLDREITDLNAQLRNLDESDPHYAEIEKRIATLEASKTKVNDPSFVGALGIAQGIRSGADAQKANFDAINNYLQGRIDRDVLERRLKDSSIRNALAKMPREQYRELMARIDNIKQLTAESESKEALNDQTVLKFQTEIEQIGDMVLRSRLSDENYMRDMIKAAEEAVKADPNNAEAQNELKFWKNGLESLTDTEFRKLKYDIGAGVVKGVATGSALGTAGGIARKILNGKTKDVDLNKIPAYQSQHLSSFKNPATGRYGRTNMPEPDPTQQADSYWKF